MAAPPPSLINKEARHQVFVEGHKTHIAGTFVDFIRKMDAALRERWGRVDLPDSMAERIAPAEVERLKKLVGHVREDMRDYYGQFYDVWREQIVDFAAYEAGWEVRSNKATFGVEFDLPARAQLRSAVLSTPLIVEGINKGDLLREFYADWAKGTVNAVDAIIRGGYYQGLTNTQIARQVFGTAKADFKDGVWGRAQRDVMALTRTAVQHAASQARREVYELNSDIVVGVQIVSTLDDRTTPLCQSLDGRIFELGEAPMPPYHIGCRTTTIPVLDPAFAGLSDGATRMAHGPEGSELVPADMTYFEWLKTQPAEFQDAAIGPKRGELLRNGGISAERFSELNLNRNFEPRTLEEIRVLEPLAFERAGIGVGASENSENKVLTNDAENSKLDNEHFGFARIEGEHTRQADTAAVNPKYEAGEEYQNNCGDCAIANELRRRGFDVEARPADGMPLSEWGQVFENFEWKRFSGATKQTVGPALKREIESWGEGARGVVFVKWDWKGEDESGHYFSAEVSGGKAKFADSQKGLDNVASYLGEIRTKKLRFARLDNLNATDKVKEHVKRKGD